MESSVESGGELGNGPAALGCTPRRSPPQAVSGVNRPHGRTSGEFVIIINYQSYHQQQSPGLDC